MRISGTYLERLFIVILPWTLLAALIVSISRNNIKAALLTFTITTLAFWLLDTLIILIKFKNPKKLAFEKTLKHKGLALTSSDINSITPLTDKRFHWSFQIIQFTLSDGTNFFVIDKPQTFIGLFAGKQSKTIKLIIEKCPELSGKINDRKFV